MIKTLFKFMFDSFCFLGISLALFKISLYSYNEGLRIYYSQALNTQTNGQIEKIERSTTPDIATVPIITLIKAGRPFCSGFVVSDNYIITAGHCLRSEGTPYIDKTPLLVEAQSLAGPIVKVPARAKALVHSADLGLVSGNFKDFSKVQFNANDDLRNLSELKAVACGFPLAGKILFCPDIKRLTVVGDLYLGEGPLYHGMSGGPLLLITASGPIAVGVVSASMGDSTAVFSPLIGLTGAFPGLIGD